MPYQWTDTAPDGATRLELKPHRSLPLRGFVVFIALTATMFLMPLLGLVGTALLWGIMPFALLAIGGVWWAITRSYRDGTLTEVLTLGSDRAELVRRAPDGQEQQWQANPYWVTVQLYPTGGPVPDYLTLKGDGREVELGAFLTAQERRALGPEIEARLRALH